MCSNNSGRRSRISLGEALSDDHQNPLFRHYFASRARRRSRERASSPITWACRGGLVGRDGPDELQYMPRNAAVVAYADVREIMTLRRAPENPPRRPSMPGADGQRQFQDQTGIDIESDIDHVVASLQPVLDGKMAGLVVARGRFSEVKIEALMREHGAEVGEYNGKRVIAYQPGSLEISRGRPAIRSRCRSSSRGWSPWAADKWFEPRSICRRAARTSRRTRR